MPTPALSTAWVPLWPLSTPLAPPGEILDYAQITANVSCAATSGATANLIVQGNSVTYDGSPIMIEFFAPATGVGATTWWLVLYDGNTQLGLLGAKVGAGDASGPVDLKVRLTPTPGVHAYNVRGFCATGALTLYAGTGAVGQNNPAFIRVSRDTQLALSAFPGVALSPPSYGTSFPLTPADGQEHILVDSTTSPTYQWRFRYNAGSASAFKWEYIGGRPAYQNVDTAQTTSSGGFTDLATVGPSFVVPRAGEYLIRYSAMIFNSAVNINFVGMMKNGGEQDRISFTSVAANAYGSMMSQKYDTFAAGDAIKLMYAAGGGVSSFERRRLTVEPLRCS
jgi:hypothetical protein